MYPSGNRPSLWTEFWVLTRAVYGIILWPVLALGALALAVGVFAWWDRRRPPPPGLGR